MHDTTHTAEAARAVSASSDTLSDTMTARVASIVRPAACRAADTECSFINMVLYDVATSSRSHGEHWRQDNILSTCAWSWTRRSSLSVAGRPRPARVSRSQRFAMPSVWSKYSVAATIRSGRSLDDIVALNVVRWPGSAAGGA